MPYLVINDREGLVGQGATLDEALIAAGEVALPAHLRVFEVPRRVAINVGAREIPLPAAAREVTLPKQMGQPRRPLRLRRWKVV